MPAPEREQPKPAMQPKPSMGRIVIYRNREGVDMPAIITAIANTPHGRDVHLHLFPPPGHGADLLSPEWGVEQARDPADPSRSTWRWPERV